MKAAILVVDDEPTFLDSVVRMLRLEGYLDVTALEHPTEVEALLEERSFDVAFLDITMPEIDGIDLLKIIKERAPETECVMVTANESIPLVTKAMGAGAREYLVKPLSPREMVDALDRALEGRLRV